MTGFVPRCAVCKGAHTAWSNACPARKKELGRVEQAKQIRSVYWHVPSNDSTTRQRRHDNSVTDTTTGTPVLAASPPALPTMQIPSNTTAVTAPGADVLAQAEGENVLPINQPNEPIVVETVPTILTPPSTQAPAEATITEPMPTQVRVARSVEEEWATPATQQAPTQPRRLRLRSPSHFYRSRLELGARSPVA